MQQGVIQGTAIPATLGSTSYVGTRSHRVGTLVTERHIASPTTLGQAPHLYSQWCEAHQSIPLHHISQALRQLPEALAEGAAAHGGNEVGQVLDLSVVLKVEGCV